MSQTKQPNGIRPATVAAWSRISDLIDAIRRQYEAVDGNNKMCEIWAKEIVIQCQIIEKFKEDEHD